MGVKHELTIGRTMGDGNHALFCGRCRSEVSFVVPDCPGPPAPSPAPAGAAEPDADEVRRAMDGSWWSERQRGSKCSATEKVIHAAARAWLKLREQWTRPICAMLHAAAPGVPWLCNREPGHDGPHVAVNWPHSEVRGAWPVEQRPAEPAPTIAQVIEACGGTSLHVYQYGDGWLVDTANSNSTEDDTPEAAIAKLYADAVQKLRDTRDAADQKLQQLGVRP